MGLHITHREVLEKADKLPAFPSVVNDVLATLDDENATLGTLIQYVERDPVITARVMSLASSAAMSGSGKQLRDMHVAISMIGLSKVREIVLGVSLAEFAKGSRMATYFWEHSVAVAVGAQELARITHQVPDFAFVGGLLHDIGQLWLSRFYPQEFQTMRLALASGDRSIIKLEHDFFGIDHCTIGKLLTEHWRLPPLVVEAIYRHHDPLHAADAKLVATCHVSEVLANALDLTSHQEARVGELSDAACTLLGINWQEDLNFLFGKIEARTEYVCRTFR